VDRRQLLMVGLAGVAATVGCGPSSPEPGPTSSSGPVTPTPTIPPTSAPAALDLADLRRRLKGSLVRPGETGYTTAAQAYNSALSVRRPIAIARVADTADVATCVRLAGGRGFSLAARSGGHSYEGWSTPQGGIVVDLAALKGVQVRSDNRVVVGAGALLIDVYAALNASGRALPAGSCPTVGIAGLTLGGGIGVLCRAYGLTCDRLVAADVVTPDGATHTVDANREPDLFWALRGGGGGNGAIVTSFTFETAPAPTISTFTLNFPPARTARVLTSWQNWMAAAPNQLWSLCGVGTGTPPTNRVSGSWIGPEGGLSAHLNELVAAVGAAPTRRVSQRLGYMDAMKFYGGCSGLSVAACHPITRGGTLGRTSFHAASRMLERPLTAASAEAVVNLVRGGVPMAFLFDALGGEVAMIRPDETAFVHRRALASVQVYSGAANGLAAVDTAQDALASIVGRGAYVNYINVDQDDWAQAYHGNNLGRLRDVVGHYDPGGIFSFPQSPLVARI
jgi:FAD/FMN-containing dehydrogenase